MTEIQAAIHHAKWLNDAWASARPNSQTGALAHKFDETLQTLLADFEAEAAKQALEPKPEAPEPKGKKE